MTIRNRIVAFAFVCSAAFFPISAFGLTIDAQEVVTIDAEVVDESIIGVGQTVTVDSTVKGDVVVAGGSVTVNGVVEGDVIAAGGNVVIDAEIQGDLRVAGGTIELSGKVAKQVTVFGGTLTVKEGAEIGGDIIFGAGVVSFDGSVGRDAWGGAGSATVGAQIGRDFSFNAVGNDDGALLQLTKDAKIGRDFIHNDRSQITIADDVTIGGETKVVAIAGGPAGDIWSRYTSWGYYYGRMIALFSLWVLGLVALWVIRPFVLTSAEQMITRPAWHLLTGFVAVLAIPLAMFLLLLTIIGAPLSVVLGALTLILVFLSKVVLSLWAGVTAMRLSKQDAAQREKKLLGAFLLGAFLLTVIGSLPVVGWAFVGVGMLWSMGAILSVVRTAMTRSAGGSGTSS